MKPSPKGRPGASASALSRRRIVAVSPGARLSTRCAATLVPVRLALTAPVCPRTT
jgi:hypothetical protein